VKLLVIILEYYLLENFIINFAILYITKLITKTKIKTNNILIGALLSSLYSLVLFFPFLLFLTRGYMKIIISILIIKITFKSGSLKLFFYQLLSFFTISFMFAGTIMGLSWNYHNIFDFLLEDINLSYVFKTKYVILGIIVSTIIARKVFSYNSRKNLRSNYIVEVEIFYENQSSIVTALIDTGNSLIEPLSKKPVFVVEFEGIKSLLSDEIKYIYEENLLKDSILFEDEFFNMLKNTNLLLIPLKSIGNESSLILGFKPDYVSIKDHDKELIRKDIVIGIYDGYLSSEMDYSGLLHYETTL